MVYTQKKTLKQKLYRKKGQINPHRMETIAGNKQGEINNKNIVPLLKTDSDLQDMDYEEAIIHDKRTYLRIY